MSEFSDHPTSIEREKFHAAFALFEAARALIDLDTSQDPYHKIFRSFIEETERRRSRADSRSRLTRPIGQYL